MERKHWSRGIRALTAFVLALILILGSGVAENAVTARRKKKTATPTPAAVATPRPEETEQPEENAGMDGAVQAEKTPDTEETAETTPEETEEPGPIIEPQAIADYLFAHGELPDNFITKQEARELGWDSSHNYVSDVAPGMSIGGDYFGNYEGKLPRVKGRKYYEADCFYTGGRRNQYRIIYSNDGHVWYTEDHYNTFTEMSPSEP